MGLGRTLSATDISWTADDGPAVHGPGEAIVLAAAGRKAALADLDGDGAAMLRQRLSACRATARAQPGSEPVT
jgi:hypothetical protein